MKLDAFIEKFLPNYEERWKEKNRESLTGNMYFWARLQFVTDHFEEALQNFTSKVCEKQIEILIEESWEFLRYEHDLVIDMRCAERPKIEDL